MPASTGLTIGQLIDRNERFHGDGRAYVCGDQQRTHRDFAIRVRRLASALFDRGLRRQDRVAILSMNSIEYLEVLGAAEWAGSIGATVNFRLAASEILAQLRDCLPKVIVYEHQYAGLVSELRPSLGFITVFICIGDPVPDAEVYEAVLSAGDPAGPPLRAHERDIAHLIYTSGTTGRPKGCLLAHRETLNKAQMHAADMGIGPDDQILITMPLFHVGAKGIQNGAQYRAACVHIHRSFDVDHVVRALADQRITIAHLAPILVQQIVEHPLAAQLDVSALRLICYSAAPMPLPVLRRGLELFGSVFHQVYGQTEGAVTVLLRSQHKMATPQDRRRLGSVGQPAIGVEVRLVDEAGAACPVGSKGEIVYRGGVMFSGYWNNSAATIETLRDGWIHSGDIGEFDEDGFLYIVDRKKDMIISGGENIYSREVEEAVLAHDTVAEVAVIGLPDPQWGEAVCAVVVLRAGATTDAEAIIASTRQRIASYKKPKRVVFTAALPKLASGKVDKKELRTLYGAA